MTYRLGGFSIDPVIEVILTMGETDALFPDWAVLAEQHDLAAIAPHSVDPASGRRVSSIQSWLLRDGATTILIDTCAGNDKERPSRPHFHRQQRPYLGRLAALGVRPEDVNIVVHTHLHVDHVGWNTRLIDGVWRPTFPRARHLVSQVELDATRRKPLDQNALTDSHLIWADSIAPLVVTGQVAGVALPAQIADGVTLEAAPGHTDGHAIVRMACGAGEALFTADLMHHPVQICDPDLNTTACADAERARATRRRVLAEAADRNLLLLPTHFGQREMVRVVRQGEGYRPMLVPTA